MNATTPRSCGIGVARWVALATAFIGVSSVAGCGNGDQGGASASTGSPGSTATPASSAATTPESIVAPFPNDDPADIVDIGDYQLSFAIDAMSEYGAPLQDLTIVGDLVGTTYGQGDDPSQYFEDQTLVVDRARACVDDVLAEGDTTRPAVVFDVDETTLSAFWMMQLQDFGFDNWLQNSMYTLAKNPAIEPVRDWFNELIELGVQPILITGRSETVTAVSSTDGSTSTFDVGRATIDNLRNEGYTTGGPHTSDPDAYEIYFQPADHAGSTASFKAATRSALEERFEIIGNLGDQLGDLGDGTDVDSEICVYKLPNPFYFIGG